MIKRKCDCPSCKLRNEQDFERIIQNPANGEWFAFKTEKYTLEERLVGYSMKV